MRCGHKITIPYKRAVVGLLHFLPSLLHTIMSSSTFTFDASALAAPAAAAQSAVQKKLAALQERLDRLILSAPDDKEELIEEKDMWVKAWEQVFVRLSFLLL
jgi:hypothetical protein